ncbi:MULTISPECIES: glycosyltransferase family 2 protein [unclassified Frankia]|uniref:glycosyltransferase n=1 Tax=unclassified Frankia TaxID=2632575 RepID=UPI002AD443C7|nr:MULTISPECIES: glycosyltransferase family 2 protein [unclassified Frankia]
MLSALVSAAIVVIALTLFATSGANLWWMLYAWRTPETYQQTFYLPAIREPAHSFSIIVPARHENESVLRATIARLVDQTHPRVEIVLAVGHDDPSTVAVAQKIAGTYPGLKISINDSEVKNKPRQLNTALADCTGDIVGVFDAESLAAAELLVHVDEVFQANDADVVQGAVQLINFQSSWYSLRNCLEYYFWFRSRLHMHAQKQFIPLGGNTVFVRRALLNEVNGWDGDCLAEDCDLGVRLSALGRKISVAFDPRLVTREETPDSIYALVKQRTRWNLGFIQVLYKGDWRRLPTRRARNLARFTLLQPMSQAFSGLVLPVALLTAVIGDFSMVITLISFLPTLPTVGMLGFEVVALRAFGQDYDFRIRIRDYARLVFFTPAYQLVLSWAAVRSAFRFFAGNFEWEKTAHVGAHLSTPAIADDAVRRI